MQKLLQTAVVPESDQGSLRVIMHPDRVNRYPGGVTEFNKCCVNRWSFFGKFL